MKCKYPDTISLHLNAHETKLIKIPTEVKGDFLLEEDLEINSHVIIHSGLYSAEDYRVIMPIMNHSSQPCSITISNDILKPEINNFEAITLESNKHDINQEKPLYNQLRTEHLNDDEKRKLLKLVSHHENIFFTEGSKLSFTSAIKHNIKTKDDAPIHAKSYRYPFCHREEVQRQIAKLLEQGIIRHSDSPWTSPVWIVPKKIRCFWRTKMAASNRLPQIKRENGR